MKRSTQSVTSCSAGARYSNVLELFERFTYLLRAQNAERHTRPPAATTPVNRSASLKNALLIHPFHAHQRFQDHPVLPWITDFQSTHRKMLLDATSSLHRKMLHLTSNRLLTEYVTVLPLGHLCWWCSSAGACCWTVQARVGMCCKASRAGDPL